MDSCIQNAEKEQLNINMHTLTDSIYMQIYLTKDTNTLVNSH